MFKFCFFLSPRVISSLIYRLWNILSSIRELLLLRLLWHHQRAELRHDRTFTSLYVVTSVWHEWWHHADTFPTSLQRGKFFCFFCLFFCTSVATCVVVSGVTTVKWRANWDPVLTSGVLASPFLPRWLKLLFSSKRCQSLACFPVVFLFFIFFFLNFFTWSFQCDSRGQCGR